jgi:hypothetical protein
LYELESHQTEKKWREIKKLQTFQWTLAYTTLLKTISRELNM